MSHTYWVLKSEQGYYAPAVKGRRSRRRSDAAYFCSAEWARQYQRDGDRVYRISYRVGAQLEKLKKLSEWIWDVEAIVWYIRQFKKLTQVDYPDNRAREHSQMAGALLAHITPDLEAPCNNT